jgi:hypothetical protein
MRRVSWGGPAKNVDVDTERTEESPVVKETPQALEQRYGNISF